MRYSKLVAKRAYQMARPVGRLTSSVNPHRIESLQSRMITANYTHAGTGRASKPEDIAINSPAVAAMFDANSRPVVKVIGLSSLTTKHSKPATGFYRGRYL